jgi:hypothetical protein
VELNQVINILFGTNVTSVLDIDIVAPDVMNVPGPCLFPALYPIVRLMPWLFCDAGAW